ncbi:MAG: glycosyltransferase [Saprospiraceae bacterium]|nr:glycosyltransferase [Saprospiraceae bacterium]
MNWIDLKNDSFTIGFVGRLDTYTKGLDLLVEAFYEFQKSQPNSKLWIIGDGEGRLFIEKIYTKKKITKRHSLGQKVWKREG